MTITAEELRKVYGDAEDAAWVELPLDQDPNLTKTNTFTMWL